MKFNILIVDDSKAALFMFKKIVGLAGVPVDQLYTAENGKEAIAVMETHSPVHLIMTDINMPVMDGLQFIQFLKSDSRFSDIPIIVITTEGRDQYIEKATQLGANNYIKKPFQPEQVKQLILDTLGVEEDESNINQSEANDF